MYIRKEACQLSKIYESVGLSDIQGVPSMLGGKSVMITMAMPGAEVSMENEDECPLSEIYDLVTKIKEVSGSSDIDHDCLLEEISGATRCLKAIYRQLGGSAQSEDGAIYTDLGYEDI